MKKYAVILFAILFSINSFAQNNPPSPLSPTYWGVVYDIPATKNVSVKKNVVFMKSGERNLAIDIYAPPKTKAGEKLPAVIFLNAIGDFSGNEVKEWAIYSSFPRLIAAHEMIGISMNADGNNIQETLKGLFGFLEKEGAKHGIDANRLGVYAASANTTQSLVYLMSENASKSIKAAALFYGATPTAETKIRKDLPVLYILAEGDASGGFGRQSVNLWQRVMEAKAPWTLVYASNLPHAFDAFTDNDESRRVIRQAISFWKTHLEPVPQPDWKPSEARAIVEAGYWNNPQRSVELLAKWIAENPKDITAYQQYGRNLSQLQRFDEADAALQKALELGGNEPGIYVGLGQIRFQQKRYAEAADYLAKSIERGARFAGNYNQLALAQMNLKRYEEAVKTFEEAIGAGMSKGTAYYNMACVYSLSKQTDKAFEMLEKAINEGFTDRNTFETDPDLEPIRSDPRFQTLLTRLPKA